MSSDDSDRLRIALSAAGLGQWTWDAATDVVTFSERAAEIFGIAPGPVLTWPQMRELLHPDDREPARIAVEDALAWHTDYITQYRLINAPRERWIAVSGRGRYDANGNAVGMVGVVHDRTRERLLASLDESLALLADPRAITYRAAEMLGSFLDVDRCAYGAVEEDEDHFEITGDYTRGVKSLVGHFRFRQFGAQCLRLVRAGQPWVVNDSATDPRLDDEDRRVYAATDIRAGICVPIHTHGRFVAAMALHMSSPRLWTAEDVELIQRVASRCRESIERARVESQRAQLFRQVRSAQEEAEVQRNLLDALFEQAPSLIAILHGPEHRVVRANAAMLAALGARLEDVVGRRAVEALLPATQAETAALFDQCYHSGQPVTKSERRLTFCRPDGSQYSLISDCVYSPFRNADGQVEGLFVISNDVGAKVRARQQIEQLRVKAEAANRAKDEFLAVLGHELRNPLAPMVTVLDLLDAKMEQGVARERDILRRQVTHLTRLVDDLMDASRIARGKVMLQREPLEIRSVVDHALETCSPILVGRTRAVDVDVPANGLRVMGDAVRLRQVVANLLTNSAKFTPPDREIRVSAALDLGSVVLEVRDAGCGIAPELLPTIFDAFTQGRQGTDRTSGGLGLGLAIVRGLVEQHGGQVEVSSGGPGQGARVCVHLPLYAEGLGRAVVDAPIRTSRELVVRQLRCLIVDDNRDAANALSAALHAQGHDVRVAHEAEQALALCREFTPDVAVLDIGLPRTDGYELARQLRAIDGLDDLPLVALTGYGLTSDRQRAASAGFTRHLVKPAPLDRIEAAIQSAVTRVRSERGSGRLKAL
ncbi:MAG TPA: ATP-binding protein [Nevskiaceae bacterium]|nr:ATP-binding protein [Nevskiaceae bacterium]